MAQATATGNGLFWSYDVIDAQGFFGVTGDYGYYFTADNHYEGSPISFRYGLSASTTYQSSSWTEGGLAPGRWDSGAVVFQKS